MIQHPLPLHVLLLLIIIVAPSACHQGKDDGHPPPASDPAGEPDEDNGDTGPVPGDGDAGPVPGAGILTREDPACLPATGAALPTSRTYRSVSNGRVRILTKSAEPNQPGRYVRRIHTGLETRSRCRRDGDPSSCPPPQVIRDSSPLPFCRTDGAYSRDSLEGVALTAFQHLEDFGMFYLGLAEARPKSFATTLQVMPAFRRTWPSEPAVLQTDNLAWYPAVPGGGEAIVILPRGEAGMAFWPDFALWESSWILAHEASHGLFRSHFAGGAGAADLRITLAVEEGFADLFATFATGPEPGLLAHFPCLEKQRDPASGVFADDSPKTLTDDVLDAFLAENGMPAGACDGPPDFRDSHTIGAIIAHGLYRLYGQGGNPATGATLALTWLESMEAAPLRRDDRSGLLRMIAAGIRTGPADARCRVAREIFPPLTADFCQSP